MVPFERALVSSYMPPIVTFPLSLRVSEIQPLLCSTAARHFCHPVSSLPQISPCSPGRGGWLLGYEERRCWPNCPCNQFTPFPIYVILIHQHNSTQVTDGRTDRQTDVQSQYRTLHRAVTSSYIGSVPDLKCSSAHMLWCVSHYITRESLTQCVR